MNKITTIGTPIHGLIGLVLFALFFSSNLSAQETYTTIRKNVNPLAFNLNHDLSSTQDSLLLENKFLFKRVRFISDKAEKVFDFKPAVKSAKVPLDELPLGKYTVMFYQADKIIVFQIERILPFDPLRGIESEVVALNEPEFLTDDVNEVTLNDSELLSDEFDGVDLEYDTTNLNIATNGKDLEYEAEEMYYKKSYNLSDADRDHVQTRAEYRRNNLRPNGKPYDD
ncbi:hypothetical protein [Psychroserpens ponticola]|uniref:DUF4138 domain-containing protein n=1 Tax=Psychroserpens ponticola TaxID=2932268 RepID=A0ABY7RVU3_9FLAO|nr:hypothetical protein [Psychroserpens ponticola]WCO00816.1 hypothetical protein MUN68_012155 [Psychroserpens ponticola]